MNLIALKMLIGDKLKYLSLVAGLGFAALLVTQQASIFTGFALQTTAWIRDTSAADLWVMDDQVEFTEDAIDALATYAYQVNRTTQNIGARRLYTIMERLLEELSFEAPDMKMGRVQINAAYVRERLEQVSQDEDLSKFIL